MPALPACTAHRSVCRQTYYYADEAISGGGRERFALEGNVLFSRDGEVVTLRHDNELQCWAVHTCRRRKRGKFLRFISFRSICEFVRTNGIKEKVLGKKNRHSEDKYLKT